MDAIFLKLDNIKGESQVEGFEDQIEIMSYSHNVAMQVKRLRCRAVLNSISQWPSCVTLPVGQEK